MFKRRLTFRKGSPAAAWGRSECPPGFVRPRVPGTRRLGCRASPATTLRGPTAARARRGTGRTVLGPRLPFSLSEEVDSGHTSELTCMSFASGTENPEIIPTRSLPSEAACPRPRPAMTQANKRVRRGACEVHVATKDRKHPLTEPVFSREQARVSG